MTIGTKEICHMLDRSEQNLREMAKRNIFPAPIKGRWELGLVVRGFVDWMNQNNQREADLKKKIDEQRERKLKLENDETEKQLVRVEKLAEMAGPTLEKFKEVLYQKLQNEMPISVAGMDVPQSRIYGTRLAAEILKPLQTIFKSWEI